MPQLEAATSNGRTRKTPRPQKRTTPVTEVMPAGELLRALRLFRKGDFKARLPLSYPGVSGDIARAFNEAMEVSEGLATELGRITRWWRRRGGWASARRCPGRVGRGRNASHRSTASSPDLVQPTTEVGRVIGAVASGDLSQKMALEIDGRVLKGEFVRTAKVVNGMVEQLASFTVGW